MYYNGRKRAKWGIMVEVGVKDKDWENKVIVLRSLKINIETI